LLTEELSTEKKKWLDEVLATETEKERLRLEFAHLAAQFVRWTKEVADNLQLEVFGCIFGILYKYKLIMISYVSRSICLQSNIGLYKLQISWRCQQVQSGIYGDLQQNEFDGSYRKPVYDSNACRS
jgi:hypothetical protein